LGVFGWLMVVILWWVAGDIVVFGGFILGLIFFPSF
jgi:hypothetical protein